MNIRILRLTMTHFKCFRSKEITFDNDVTTIQGRNGSGKTTIADAIFWCLFGKNSQGQSDFDLKTHDENGKPIPHLDHSVEMVLVTSAPDDATFEITLKRTLKETWIKKRGSEEQVFKNNTTEYFVNGDTYTAADYKKYIAELIDDEVFKAITNPTYFPSLKWNIQRDFLTKMVDMSDVAPTKEELEGALAEIPENQTLIEYRKHLSYQIKGIKDKLELIPTRLAEQNKALPELLDWDALEQERNNAQKELDEIDAKMLQINAGNGADIKRTGIQNRIKELKNKQKAIYEDIVKQNLEAYKEKQKKISDASLKFNEALNNQKLMQQTIEADQRLIERANEVDFEAQLQALRDQWPSSKFNIDPSTSYCPTCGQPLPQEQVQEKIAEMRKNFNLQREAKIKQLNEAAAKVNKDKADAAEELQRLQQKLEDDTKAMEDIKESINTIFAEKQELEKIVVKTVDEMLAESVEFNDYEHQIALANNELSEVADTEDNKQLLDELASKKTILSEGLNTIVQQLATRIQYEKGLALIDGINEEEKDLIRHLSELEKKEDVVRRYQDRHNAILEERINEHFQLVKWKMFRTVNNGGDPFDEPYCECYVDGVAYHDGLNQAARLNAGLDICEALCRYYNISAPILIDNAESCLNIYPTTGQQVRLQVSPTELSLV